MSLQRSTPLRRSPLRRKRLRRLDRPGSDPGYKAWVHTQCCSVGSMGLGWWCEGPIQQAHLRNGTGIGRKEPDRNSIPLCRSHHEQYDQHRGVFEGWDRSRRLAWFLLRIAEANAAYIEQGGVLAP